MDAVTQVPAPVNEPVLDYAPGSPERAELQAALAELGSSRMDLPHVIGGKRVTGTGEKGSAHFSPVPGIFTSSYNVVFLIQAIHSTFQLEITNKYCDLFMVDV